MYDKKKLLEILIQQVIGSLHKSDASFVRTKKAALDAYGPMESRYDTTRSEQGWLADGIAGRLSDEETGLAKLLSLSMQELPISQQIVMGSVFRLERDGMVSDYFMLPHGAGYGLSAGEKEVHVVTPQSPIGKSSIGKWAGDTVDVALPRGNMRYSILEVC